MLGKEAKHGFSPAGALGTQQNAAAKGCLKILQRSQRLFRLAVYRHIGQDIGRGCGKIGPDLRVGFQAT